MGSFIQGLLVGLAYAAPIGIQNLFVMNTAMTCPRKRALFIAGIVVCFDVSFSLVCFFGIGAVLRRVPWIELAILLFGSFVVIWMGIGCLRNRPKLGKVPKAPQSIGKCIVSAGVVTWCNPQAIVDGTMLLGTSTAALSTGQAGPFLLGVALASCIWFPCLTLLISRLGSWFQENVMDWLNRICGIVIILYGGKLLIQFLVTYVQGK